MSMYPVTPIPLGYNNPSRVLGELMKVGSNPPVPSEHRLTEDWDRENPLGSMRTYSALKGLQSFALPNRNQPFNQLEG